MSEEHREVITTHRAVHYTAWNLAGSLLPMVVALFAFRILEAQLDKERLGALFLIWMLVGYFSILDLGLGRALTKMTAEWLGKRRESELPTLFWTSVSMMIGFGVLGAVVLYSLAPWLVQSALNMTPALHREAIQSFYVVSAGLPLVILTVGLVGVLEAHHQFRFINLVRIPMGSYSFFSPLLVLPFTHSLVWIVAVLVAGRVIEGLLYFGAYVRIRPEILTKARFERSLIRPLITFGGWMTISNFLLPLMIHVDRFLIGAWVAVALVSFYAIPSEMVVKLLIFPRSWVTVLFPSFAAHYERDPSAVSELFKRGVKFLLLGLFPVMLMLLLFAPEGLGIWLGPDMAEQSTGILRGLAYGMYLYSLVYVPYLFLQSIGKPMISALIHAVEFPLYLGAAWVLIHRFGLMGAVYAWLLRVVLDLGLMFGFASRFLERTGAVFAGNAACLAVLSAVLWGGVAVGPVWGRVGYAVVVLAVYLPVVWLRLLSAEERADFLRMVRR